MIIVTTIIIIIFLKRRIRKCVCALRVWVSDGYNERKKNGRAYPVKPVSSLVLAGISSKPLSHYFRRCHFFCPKRHRHLFIVAPSSVLSGFLPPLSAFLARRTFYANVAASFQYSSLSRIVSIRFSGVICPVFSSSCFLSSCYRLQMKKT